MSVASCGALMDNLIGSIMMSVSNAMLYAPTSSQVAPSVWNTSGSLLDCAVGTGFLILIELPFAVRLGIKFSILDGIHLRDVMRAMKNKWC